MHLGRKAITNLDSVLKGRNMTWPTKVHIVKAMAFPVVVYGCESRTIKKAEHQKIDAFELWCWRRLLRVSWTARRSNQSILKEINYEFHWKDWCWSWSSNTLATWWEEPTHWKKLWCWERLQAGGEGGNRGWDGWMASLTHWTWVWANSQKIMKDGEAWHAQSMGSQRVRRDLVTEQQKNKQNRLRGNKKLYGKEQVVFITNFHFIAAVIYSHFELINTRKLY